MGSFTWNNFTIFINREVGRLEAATGESFLQVLQDFFRFWQFFGLFALLYFIFGLVGQQLWEQFYKNYSDLEII